MSKTASETTFLSIDHWETVAVRELVPGATAMIAVHNTYRGPALGGCRMFDYQNSPVKQLHALEDVLRLSRGMSYKAAAANLPLGGGKAVIVAETKGFDGAERDAMFLAFGDFVESLGGRYITAEDVNTKVSDMSLVRQRTRHVTGLDEKEGGLGDPSPLTAYGVFESLRYTAERFLKRPTRELTVAVQGAGKVGFHLCLLLRDAGFRVMASDVSDANLARVREAGGIEITAADAILDAPADIFAPCAMGKVLTTQALTRLKARVICGAANNQLESPAIDEALRQCGVVYAPDYVVNLGGLTMVQQELAERSYDLAKKNTRDNAIQGLDEIYTLAASEQIPTGRAADRVMYRRFHPAA